MNLTGDQTLKSSQEAEGENHLIFVKPRIDMNREGSVADDIFDVASDQECWQGELTSASLPARCAVEKSNTGSCDWVHLSVLYTKIERCGKHRFPSRSSEGLKH